MDALRGSTSSLHEGVVPLCMSVCRGGGRDDRKQMATL